MEGIRKILWRNIKKNKVGVVALCVGCVVCSLLLLCTFVINCSIDQSFNEQYKKMAGPIYVLTVKNDVSEESLIDFVESREYVDVFQVSRRCIIKNTKIGDKSYSFAYCETNDKYGKDDFVTCNSACLNAEIGDHVEFPLGDESINLCVENIIDDPVNASPEELNAVVYVSGNMFEEICSYGSNGEYIIRIIDGDAYEVSKLVKDFSLYFEQNFRGTSKMLDDIRHNYTYRYMIVGKYLTPILFFVFVVLIVLSTLLMILVVSDERDTINLYKVIGLPNSKIIIVYLLQYMVLIVSSSILGVAIGAFLLNRWLRTMFIYTRIESFHIVNILGWSLLTWFAITTIELLVLCISLYKNIFPSCDIVPAMNPGRGLIEMDDIYEFQTSLIFNDSILESNLNYVFEQLNKFLKNRAKKIPVMPKLVTKNLLEQEISDLTAPTGFKSSRLQRRFSRLS